ncbi:MAG: hypothetical protein ABFD04_10660, partial [Syntrophomonas sp.]
MLLLLQLLIIYPTSSISWILSTAVLMTTVFVYEWICYRVDGPSYAKAFDDERLTQVYTIFGNLS